MAAQVAAWDEVGDQRAVFLDCYRRMTEAVVHDVDAGRFDDGVWVSALLDRFADYYFLTVDEPPDDAEVYVPEPWLLAHAAAMTGDGQPIQLLLAGVNAHINYDLVLTLVDLLDGEWADADDDLRHVRQRDYDLINLVIAETADLVQDEVVERRSPWLDLFDRGLGRFDERFTVRLLSRWRTQVWRHAVEIVDDPADRDRRVVAIEQQCARRARWLLV